MSVALAPFVKFRGFDNNGNPLANGLLFTYAAGTTTKLATYTDSTGTTTNTNPIILNSRGECDIWMTSNLYYKLVLAPATDTDPPTNPFWTEDQLAGINFAPTTVNNALLNQAQSFSAVQSFTAGIVGAQSTFAGLPGASTLPIGTQYMVTDVGLNSSLWETNGTAWFPVGGIANLYSQSIPFIFPPNGSIAVTTGTITLGTALDAIYPNCYMYFPAGAWTGSTAGWYYVAMSSTTVGTVYSNNYTGGIPTIPGTPLLVTTGAGAYTQTTASYIAGPQFTVQANLISANGKIRANYGMTAYNSAGNKFIKAVYGTAVSGDGALLTTGLYATNLVTVSNQGIVTSQSYVQSFPGEGVGQTSVNSAVNQTFSLQFKIATATDWVILQYSDVQLIE